MSYLGSWKIDDTMVFTVNTHNASTGAATDADAVPAYRVYEDETSTAILTGNMAKLDDANTTGFYSEQLTLSAANGLEKGKSYNIYISAAVSSITGTISHNFQMEAEVDANVVSDKTGYSADMTAISGDSAAADNLEAMFDDTGYTASNSTIGTVTTNTDMRGTDNAALASVVGALTDAAAAGDPTTADTVMQYVKQLINILIGTTGVTTYPAEAAPANNVSLAEVIRAIHTDVTGLNGDAMRGTDSAALASDYTSARAGYLDNINGHTAQTGDNFARLGAPAGASVSADIAQIQSDTDDIQTRLPAALTTGTADSGTDTTMVDAALTEADTDYWAGNFIRFTSGTISGQTRLITAFTPASDTVTFAPATTQAVATNTYEIIPFARVDVAQWLGNAVTHGTGGPDVNVNAVSDDTTAATNLEAMFDDTGFNASNSTVGTVTTLTGHTAQTGDNFARLGAPAGASVSADIAENQTDLNTIIADTNELQTDWVDGGRLDAILDARASQTTADAIETDTQDIQSRLPAALVTGRMSSDAVAISGSTEAADNLEASAETIVVGTAQTGTLSTTVMTSDLTEATDDHYIGRIIIWTSGVLQDQATDITDYSGTNGTLTYTAVTEAPSNGDTFVIV